MNRIFPILAAITVGFLAAAMLLGFSVGDLETATPTPSDLTKRTVHALAGLAAALMVVLLHSIVVTYFIGTSRWCREVAEAYSLDPTFLARSTGLKRRTFLVALLGMLSVVGISAQKAAADPGNGLASPGLGGASWSVLHLAGAFLGSCFLAYSFGVEWINIDAHRRTINDILAEVRRIRLEKGLEV